jgi:tRNA-modifying protein YgfZ
MFTSSLLDRLAADGAVFDETAADHCVVNFGDTAAEIETIRDGNVVVPLSDFIRLRATGKDRARFLHNFCTNNVTALNPGQSLEAFFTDAKAHVLAHGFVRAFDDRHEIWILKGDESAILKHLQKYIITEDVTIESVSAVTTAFALAGPNAKEAAGDLPMVSVEWDGVPVVFAVADTDQSDSAWAGFQQHGCRPVGMNCLHHLRIRDAYPLMGIDLTEKHLAPEGNRNNRAISYAKGCYLGQEPIARMDAMGHVNKALRCMEIDASVDDVVGGTVCDEGGTDLGALSSIAPGSTQGTSVALGVIKVRDADLSKPVTVKNSAGDSFSAVVK